ncbi:hypothetical protein PG997_003448 [Apiospora hydei]|uniref:Uncharacterized protein n=1 Tax=Apiospora hydei TaxID=1337664 RepID=A0ABR1WZE3_9PEZI
MCCKIPVFALTLFGLWNCLRAPSHYWNDLLLNVKLITAPSTSRLVVPMPLALFCYDAYGLLWTCVATPVMIWTVVMNFAFCFSWVYVAEPGREASAEGLTQRTSRLRRWRWPRIWARMAVFTLIRMDSSEDPINVVARVYYKDLKIMEAGGSA